MTFHFLLCLSAHTLWVSLYIRHLFPVCCEEAMIYDLASSTLSHKVGSHKQRRLAQLHSPALITTDSLHFDLTRSLFTDYLGSTR